jgi:Tol biopolymer transport system component
VANNLLPGDTTGGSDVFVRDRQLGTTELVSVSTDDKRGDNVTQRSAISGNGRYVAFQSFAGDLVPGDTGQGDIFVRDLQAGTTEWVSVSTSGVQDNFGSEGRPAISSDGRYVAFQSAADNLVPGDTNFRKDIFVRDRQAGTTERVSVSSTGAQAIDESVEVAISADGRYVAFSSYANNLVADDTNSITDIFVHDRQTATTERVNVTSEGLQVSPPSTSPSISDDGRLVAFDSHADTLVAGDTNFSRDIFVHNRQTRTTERVNVSVDEIQANSHSSEPVISGDGRCVAFESYGDNLVDGDTNAASDIFVHLLAGFSIELTQAIQVWQTVGALKAELADDLANGRPPQPPVPIVAGKPAVLRVYPNQVSELTDVTVEVSGVVTASEAMTLNPACTPENRRRGDVVGGTACLSAGFYFVPPVGDWSATVTLKDASGTVLGFALESKASTLWCSKRSRCATWWTATETGSAPILASWLALSDC